MQNNLDAQRKDETPPSSAPPSAEFVREELEKILASRAFRSAERQKNFLRYVVEQTLAGRGDLIKEYSIGIEVFHRGESFDPRESSIVRSEARKLRTSLARYYESEGERDAVRIEFPKGGYTPFFRQTGNLPAVAVAPAELAAPPPKAAPAAESGVAAAPLPRVFRARNLWWRLAAALPAILLLAGVATWLVRRDVSPKAASPGAASIAVLPFLNLTDNKDDEIFSDGLAEDLIDSLARVPGVKVVARSSAFQYRDKSLDIRKIGRDLNVRTVLEGSVRKYGDRLRVTAQLNDATTGYHLWSDSYDRDMKDTLTTQREISGAITHALGGQLAGVGTPAEPPSARSLNPAAYQDYLRGIHFHGAPNATNIKAAIGYFQSAIDKDPSYAAAWAGLAGCYRDLPAFTTTPYSEVVPKIRAAASKALALDPAVAEAHIAMAWALVYDYDWQVADGEFRKALELSPGNAFAHRSYVSYLDWTGRLDEALAESRRAIDLDPVSSSAAEGLARTLYYMHRYPEAIEQYQNALALAPNSGTALQAMGLSYIMSRKYVEGTVQTEVARRIQDDTFTAAQLAYAYAVSGRTADAREILNQLLEQSKSGYFSASAIARVYIGLGDKDSAMEWLRKAVERKESITIKAEPIYDPLRGHPRFAELLRLAKLS